MRIACGDLSRWFEQRTAIVTPSSLLAAVARQQFAREQLARGAQSWNRTAISTLDVWLVARWSEARYAVPNIPALLSTAQEHALWRQVIEQGRSDVFDFDAAADLCRQAVRLIGEWGISLDAPGWNEREGAQQFLRWLKQFRDRCGERGWIARSDLWRLVPEWIRAGYCKPEPAMLCGFQRSTPALKQLNLGGGLEPARSFSSATPIAIECASLEEELERAARWSRFRFDENRGESLAVFVPGLAAKHALVRRVFSRVFYPSRAPQPRSSAPEDSVFSVNAYAPLTEHPIAASAVLVIELARERISLHTASALLRCPFLAGAAAERSERALADVALRKWRRSEVNLRDLERVSEKCPKLQRAWMRVRRVLRGRPTIAEFSRWSKFFGDLLRAVRWPGEAELTSQEQDATSGWQDALSEFASLGLVVPPATLDTAQTYLRRLLARGLDQANLFAPVQILDSADAAGVVFDAAFLAGMSEENWPPRQNPNPLVPLAVQRAYGVPGSSAESVHREKQRLTNALLSAAPEIEASYSGTRSPWLRNTLGEGQTAKPTYWLGKLAIDSFAPAILESVDDTHGPVLTHSGEARGGTFLIKSQSQCPFRAFAEIRLRAGAPEDAALGVDSRDRGTFLHKALQGVWQELRTLDRLRSATEEELRETVRNALVNAVDGRGQTPLEQLARQTERERLEEVILEWLAVEREREQSFTVETVEQEREHLFAGLELKLRIDRIDRLENGKVLLIDYKSGAQSTPKWQDERPQEPQLLVYAAALGQEVDGLFLCQLKPRDMKPLGCSRDKQFAAKSAAVESGHWDEFLEHASECVEKLAGDFARGYAALDPAPHACDYCKLGPLCRIGERKAIQDDEADG